MTTARFIRIAVCIVAALIAAGCHQTGTATATHPAAQSKNAHASTPEVILADFESSTDGWQGSDGGSVTLSNDHATHGGGSLKVDLNPGPYPGVGAEFATPQDWSGDLAVRCSIFNASLQTVALSVRADDAASHDYATRYNGDMYPYKLAPGPNEIEVTIAALRQGSFLSRGLDVTAIKRVRFFAQTSAPQTIYLDNVRLVPRPAPVAARIDLLSSSIMHLADNSAQIKPYAPTAGQARIALTPGRDYPGISFTGFERDWLSYQVLHLSIDGPVGLQLSAKLTDAAGRSQTVALPPLRQGANELAIPLEIAAQVSLGKVAEFQLFSGRLTQPVTFTLTKVTLEREPSEDFPNVQDASATNPPLTLDLSKFNTARNTCVMAMIRIPLASGGTRIVRCNAPGRGPAAYAIPASCFAGATRADAGRPVNVWVFVSDHGVWGYWQQDYVYDGTPKTLSFVAGEQK